jgi:hypothetical protein
MPRFRRKPRTRRARRSWHPFRRRHKDRRISVIGTVGAVGSTFAPRVGSTMGIGQWVLNTLLGKSPNLTEQDGFYNGVSDMIAQYVGYDPRFGNWGIPSGTITLIGSAIAAKIANKFGKGTIERLPWIGKYVKW